ncbi:hypothetical protein [Paenibacillus planticolens]|uniref:Uncharacterized protein n=1 Tax=Paenibacillus planticolens TaxID=2654976 RepID=A0ABX1ZHG0_9BACL|nr:hypothetical protein [Paenibacillus planticolens]NOU99521.1 hypothetical protein [Paenibacillus planticolens]
MNSKEKLIAQIEDQFLFYNLTYDGRDNHAIYFTAWDEEHEGIMLKVTNEEEGQNSTVWYKKDQDWYLADSLF